MAIYVPKQNPDYRVELAKLINGYLAEREWSPARLARESGQSKATISRITNYKNGNPKYQPSLRTIQAIALTLKLSPGADVLETARTLVEDLRLVGGES